MYKIRTNGDRAKITIRELNLFYHDFHALKDISMDIPENKVTAFIGPSGSGKSSFLRVLNRMNDLSQYCRITGVVCLDGEDIYGNTDVTDLRMRVGLVFQKPNPFPMSIRKNITYGPRMQGQQSRIVLDRIVEESLQKAALWDEVKDRLDASALSLSKGQQQRLCIARAIAVHPEVILMDEPTSALDPIAAKRIEELISSLKKEYTIILVTHSLSQAIRISDRTAFLLFGDMIEYGDTGSIFEHPDHVETRKYITGRIG